MRVLFLSVFCLIISLISNDNRNDQTEMNVKMIIIGKIYDLPMPTMYNTLRNRIFYERRSENINRETDTKKVK